MKSKGFSLMELLVAVAIVGILAAVAYPAYTEYVRESRRVDAQAVLMEMAQWLERQHTVNGRYHTDAVGNSTALPVTKSPKDGNDEYYSLTLSAAASTFTITATASGAQSGDACGNLTYTQSGVRGATGPGSDCWDD